MRLGGLSGGSGAGYDLAAEEVSKGMAEGRYLLVDVREPNEVRGRSYPGAVDRSTLEFRSEGYSRSQGKQVVFGLPVREKIVTASLAAQKPAGWPYDKHLAGACWPGRPRDCDQDRRLTSP